MALVFVAPVALLEAALRRYNFVLSQQEGVDLGGAFRLIDVFGWASGTLYVLHLFTVLVVGVGMSHAVDSWHRGKDPKVRDVLRFVVRRSGVIVAVFVLNHVLQILGAILLGIPAVFAVVLGSLCAPVLAVEGGGPIVVLRRSWTLVRRGAYQVFWLIVLLASAQLVVAVMLQVLPWWVAEVAPGTGWALTTIAKTVADVIMVPVSGAAMALVYFDVRYRLEGIDIERRLQREHVDGSRRG